MSLDITVSDGASNTVVLRVHGYEHPNADNPDDANWLRCDAKAQVAGFSGSTLVSVLTGEFLGFEEELARLCEGRPASGKGTAVLSTVEEGVLIHLTRRSTGGVLVQGSVQRLGLPKVSLSFEFECGESDVRSSLAQLRRVTTTFPQVPGR